MEQKESRAILLRKTDIKEEDMLYTFYTESYGKIKLYKKKAKGKNSFFCRGLEPYNIVRLRFRMEEKEILLFNDFHIEESFHEIIQSFDRTVILSVSLELLDKIAADRDPNFRVFQFIEKAMRFLRDSDINSAIMLMFVMIKMTQLFGVSPALSECISCRKITPAPKVEKDVLFSLEGGLKCSECCQLIEYRNTLFKITSKDADLICKFKACRFEDIQSMQIHISNINIGYLIDVFYKYIKYHFNIELKSMKIYDSTIKY